MPLSPDLVPGINLALNESEVAGIRMAENRSRIDLLLHVDALPEFGPLDPDGRRAIALGQPSHIQVLLRPSVANGHGK